MASLSGCGMYGLQWDARLIRRGSERYLVCDQWCGTGQIRGECYRPHVYKVPDGSVAKAASLLAPNSKKPDRIMRYAADRLQCLGEQPDRGWMSSL